MIIDCAHYKDGRRRDAGQVPLEVAAARRAEGGFIWLGLFEPGEEKLAQVHRLFGLHELAVADALTDHRRPKIETYQDDLRLVILRTAHYDDEEAVHFGEIGIFFAPTFVITVRRGAPTERIYSLRSEATGFYRAVHPLVAIVDAVERTTVARRLRPYLRDVYDRLLLVEEEVADQRDLLGLVLEANMTVISVEQTRVGVRQNSTIERLTVLATIFLPLTFITGFFDQNFGWMVDHIDTLAAFVIYGIGGLAVALVLLSSWLRIHPAHTDTRAAAGETTGRNGAARTNPHTQAA